MKFFQAACAMADTLTADAPDWRPMSLRKLDDAQHPTCLYYRFLDAVVARFGPLDAIEIGTYKGTSAAHLAMRNYFQGVQGPVRGHVTTIDIEPDAKRCVDALDFPNITSLVGDSLNVYSSLSGIWDLLYIDGIHNFSQAYQEYFFYRRLVRTGGLILIDDAGLDMGRDEMNAFWNVIEEPKVRVDHLHPNVGFGIVEKTDRDVMTPREMIDAFERGHAQ